MKEFLLPIYGFLDPLFLIYFAIINVIYIVLYLFGSIRTFFRMREIRREDFKVILRSNSLPEISFIVPAYNEFENIMTTVNCLLSLTYRYKQIIIVNDGSEDETLNLLKYKLDLVSIPKYYEDKLPTKPIRGVYQSRLYPDITVIDKVNGQKFDALNAGLNVCRNDYFCNIDSDTFIDDEGFNALIRPILSSPENVSISATVRIKNGCDVNYNTISTEPFPNNYLATMQAIEYMRSALMRAGWDYAGGNYGFSGAFSCFLKDVVVEAGGFAPTFTNDLEIVIRLQRVLKDKKVAFNIIYLPDPVSWTEGPRTLKALGKQRSIWQRGELESLWFHKRLFFNPKYKAFGLFVYPFLLLGEAIEPLVEIFAYIYIIVGLIVGIVNPNFILLFLAVTLGLIFVGTLFCLIIEELSFRKYSTKSLLYLFFYSLIENFGYRQITLFWRARGTIDFFEKFGKIRKKSRAINRFINTIE